MAKSRQFSRNLSRILDRTSSPVYLIGAGGEIVYANSACCDWLGRTTDDLVGCRCLYTTHQLKNPVENWLRGLAPPPETLDPSTGRSTEFDVFLDSNPESSAEQSSDTTIDSVRSWRRATATLIDQGKLESPFLLVVCNGEPKTERGDLSASGIQESQDVNSFVPASLHQALIKISASMAGRFDERSLIGESLHSADVLRKFKAATESSANVLIVGPTGTGREHLARTIFTGRRANADADKADLIPIVIDCPVADPELIQRVLRESRRGKVSNPRAPHPPTRLLLLELDQLKAAAQEELLGFIQMPRSSFQIVSTATTSPAELVRRDAFNSRLARHVNTLTVELEPLKSRSEDIPLLAQRFLEQFNSSEGERNKSQQAPGQLGGFVPAAMQMLIEFDWPGNIDQLARIVQRAAANATGTLITVEDLPASFRDALRAMNVGSAKETKINLVDYLAAIETELIARAMQQAGGNKSKAARLLGVSRPKLLRRLQPGSGADDDDDEMVDPSAFEEADD